MKKEKILLTNAALFLAFNVSAQDTLKNEQLNEVVISATRSEKNIKEVSRAVTVLTSEDIKKSGANSIAELLSQQQGIYVVGGGQNPGMTASIFTRGSNSNQTVILIDGVRITDPSAINNSIDVAELSLLNIDKIEIVRGAHSTLYGSSAIGGVINIITKKSKKTGFSIDANFTLGAFGEETALLSENIYVNYGLKNGFYVGAELLNVTVSGLNATVDTVTVPGAYRHGDDSDNFGKLDWVGKAGFKNQKWDVYASYKSTKQSLEIDKAAYKDDDNYIIDFKRSLFTFGVTHKRNDRFSISYIGGMSFMDRIATKDSSRSNYAGTYDKINDREVIEGKTLNNEFQANYTIKGLNLVYGIGAYDEFMKINTRLYYYDAWAFPSGYKEIKTSTDSINPKSSTANIFLHTDLGGDLISEKYKAFTLSGGVRVSMHSVFGTNTTYEINPSVKVLDGGLLYATYATGYNAPSLYQLYNTYRYYTWDNQSTSGITRGNKNLKPETSKTFEIGYKQTFNNISLSAAYFTTEVENVIEYVYLWNKDVSISDLGTDWMRDDMRGETYINLGTMYTQGVELGVSSNINEKFSVSANVSLVSGKLKYKPHLIDSSQTKNHHVQVFGNGAFIYDEQVEALGLTRRPNTANLSFTYMPLKALALRADIRHVGSRADVYYESTLGPWGALATVPVEQYTLLDLSARVTIYKAITASIRVENILDKEYYEINGITTRGRGYYWALVYSFK